MTRAQKSIAYREWQQELYQDDIVSKPQKQFTLCTRVLKGVRATAAAAEPPHVPNSVIEGLTRAVQRARASLTNELEARNVARTALVKNWKIYIEKKRRTAQTQQIRAQLIAAHPCRITRETVVSLEHVFGLQASATTQGDLCEFLASQLPIGDLHYRITSILGSGNYGIVMSLVDSAGVKYVMKVGRILEEDQEIIVHVNAAPLEWRSITAREFRHGVRMQQIVHALRMPTTQAVPFLTPAVFDASSVKVSAAGARIGLLVMSNIDGRPLHSALTDNTVSENQKIVYLKTAANIMRRLHNLGYTHGDLHTGNVMVTSSHHLYLIDFDRTMPTTNRARRDFDLASMLHFVSFRHHKHICTVYYNDPLKVKPDFNYDSRNKQAVFDELWNSYSNMLDAWQIAHGDLL